MKWTTGFFFIMAFVTLPAQAIQTLPMADHTQPRSLRFDISARPSAPFFMSTTSDGIISVTDPAANTGSIQQPRMYCFDNSNESRGACDNGTAAGVFTDIRLRFTEKHSGQQVTLTMQGKRMTYASSPYTSWGQISFTPPFYSVGYAPFYYAISPEEMAKIPSGGIWQATLQLRVRSMITNQYYVWQWPITFDVTDEQRMDILFPDSNSHNPKVDLNIRPLPGVPAPGGLSSGRAHLNMCLYDGYNGHSSNIEMRITGQQRPAGISNDLFSIYHTSAGLNPEEDRGRLDFRINVQNPVTKTWEAVQNGETFIWQNTAQRSSLVPVVLSSGLQVLCWPTVMEFTTPGFRASEKMAGLYQGIVTVVFTPSLQ
ncbi:hypothetical protein A9B99_13710 [Mangrovibacter phragmitis]|uniref:Uncharacterized protein n=1 Tax=Mangrovibacter phragmitis TaxID=1691903 RepID=A0A1B7L0D8_9ENTR|nr:CfaE/CblD family pilus tip adhesin [Mangrovibacter phragmitis]OAT75862.1 hypothetical protein A9B99_13710 [Mangrovibacter phragmitis]